MTSVEETLKSLIRDIPDFPKPGIVFKDICPLLASVDALRTATEALAAPYKNDGVTKVCGIESRGFIFGSLVAVELGVGFIPIRKPGKLPHDVHTVSYELEYGQDSLEIHRDALESGDSVLIIDDLLATGGTMGAACQLVEELEAQVRACAVIVELSFLNGRKALGDRPLHTLISY